MNAINYLVERTRMCKSMECCDECPAYIDGECYVAGIIELKDPIERVRIVEEWAVENHPNTRQSEYLKMFPHAKLDEKGILRACPRNVGAIENCPSAADGQVEWCSLCRRNYWSTIIEKEEQ